MHAHRTANHLVFFTVLVFVVGVIAAGHVSAQNVECSSQKIISGSQPGTSTLELCLRPFSKDPGFLALLARLDKLAAADVETRKIIARLAESVGKTSGELSPKQLDLLAANIARKINPGGQETDAALLREIQRMQLNLDEFQEKVAELSKSQGGGKPPSEIGSQFGDDVAQLKFEAALNRIEASLNGHKTPFESDSALVDFAKKDAEKSLADAQAARAETRCAKDWPFLIALRDAAEKAVLRGDVNTAGSTYNQLKERADGVAMELRAKDSNSASFSQLYQTMLSSIATARNGIIQRQSFSKRLLSLPGAQVISAAELSEADQRSDALLAKAKDFASKQMFQEATALAVDAVTIYSNLMSGIKPDGQAPTSTTLSSTYHGTLCD